MFFMLSINCISLFILFISVNLLKFGWYYLSIVNLGLWWLFVFLLWKVLYSWKIVLEFVVSKCFMVNFGDVCKYRGKLLVWFGLINLVLNVVKCMLVILVVFRFGVLIFIILCV